MAAINLDIGGNTRRLDRDIQKTVNKVYSINLKTKGDQPLGRITGKVNEFNKSLDASNARVIAFGASAGIIFGLERAFGALVRSTIEVQKSLQDINVILNVSSEQLQKFGSGLFSIARNTGQSFQEVAKAATEFSRQGLGVTETLKRTNEALILARLSGLDTAASVETLTAAVNSFADQAVTATEVVNKFATVDAAFAVSSADLADAISRVGSSAAQSGVSLNELIAIVTSAQQTTARGGAVIGNSFKTIFTRLQREKVVDLLESLGISNTDANGQVKSTIQLLTDLGKVYDTLGSQQQAYVAEQVGGVFQINILKAALADLGKEFSIYNSALKVSAGATDQALRRNEELNKSYAAQINALQENARQLAAAGGERLLGPSIDRLVGGTNAILGGINEGDGQGIGAQLGKGIIDGLGQFIAGPGLVLIGGVLLKLFSDLSKFATGSFQQLLGLNTAATQQKDLQQSITQILSKNPDLLKLALQGTEGLNTAANALLANLKNQTVELQNQEKVAARIAKAFATQAGVRVAGGIPVVPTGKSGKAAGYIPNFAEELQAKELGAKSNVKAVRGIGKIGGKPFEANNQEFQLRNFAGTGETAVIPKYGNGIKEAAQMIARGESGSVLDKSDRNKAMGFVPNFATVDTVANLQKQASKSAGLLNQLYNVGDLKDKGIRDEYFRPTIKRVALQKNVSQYTKEADSYIKNAREKASSNPSSINKVFQNLKYGGIPIYKFTDKIKPETLLDPKKDRFNNTNIKGAMGEIDSQKRFGSGRRTAEKQGDLFGADFVVKKQGGNYLVESKITQRKIPDNILIAKALQYEGKTAGGKYKNRTIDEVKLKNIILSYAPFKNLASGFIPNFAQTKEPPTQLGNLDKIPNKLGNKVLSLIYPGLSEGYTLRPATASYLKKQYTGNIPVAGISQKKLQSQLPDIDKNIGNLLVKEANQFGQALGGFNFLKSPEELPNYGAAKGAVGVAFEGGVQTLLQQKVGKQNAGIDFRNITPRLRSIFNNAPGIYDAKRSPELTNEVLQKLLNETKPGATVQKTSGKAGTDYLKRRSEAVTQLRKEGVTGSVAIRQALKDRFGIVGKAAGFIPNFAAIQDAVNRERSAGVPSSQIYVAQEKALTSANPMGIGVFNKRDEPTKKSRKDVMRRKGFARGFVPNFAVEDSQGGDLGTTIGTLTAQLSGLAFAFAFNAGQYKDSLKQLTQANLKTAKEQLKQSRLEAKRLEQRGLGNFATTAREDASKRFRASATPSILTKGKAFAGANAFGLSFAAPIIGETIKNLAGTETKERRVTGAVGAGLGQVGSFAGIGALIGKGKGAAIGTAVGAILAIPEVVNQLVSNVPELTKASQQASESLTKFSEAGQRYFTSLEKLNSAIGEDGGRNEKLISQARNEYIQALSELSVADQKALTQAEKLGNAQEKYAQLLEEKVAKDRGAKAALEVGQLVTESITGESLKQYLGGLPRLIGKGSKFLNESVFGTGGGFAPAAENVIQAYTPKSGFDPLSANAKVLERSFLDLALAGKSGSDAVTKLDQILKAFVGPDGKTSDVKTSEDLKQLLTQKEILGTEDEGSRRFVEELTKRLDNLTGEEEVQKAIREIIAVLRLGSVDTREKTKSAIQSETIGEKDRIRRIQFLKQEKSAIEATIKAIQTSIASTNIFTSALEQFAESARSFEETLRISQEFTAPKEFLSNIFSETPGVKGTSSLEKTLELGGGFAEIQNELTGTINTIFSEFKTSIRDNIQTPFDEAFAKISDNLSATTFEGVATNNIKTKGTEERTKAFEEQKKLNSTMSSVETLMQQFISGQIDDKEFQQKSITALQNVGVLTGESKKIGSDIQLAVATSGAKLLGAAQAAQQRRKQLATEAVQKVIQEKIGQALGVFGGFKGFLERPDQKSPLKQITPIIDKISEIRGRGEFRYNNRGSIREQEKMAPALGRGFIQLYQTLNEFSGGAFRGILQKRIESGATEPTRGRGGMKGETGGFGDIVKGIRTDLENQIKEFEARIKTESRPGGDKVLARDLQDFVNSIKQLGIENVAQLQAASATGTGTQSQFQKIFKEYGSESLKALEKLPGIGPEIAKAVAKNTGFTQDNPLLNEAQLQSSYQVQMIGFLSGIQDAIIKTGVGEAKNIKPYMAPGPTSQNAQNNQETPTTNRQQNAVQAARQTAPLEKSIVSQITALSQNTTAISNLTGAIASLKSSIDQPQVNNQTAPQNNTPTITNQTSAPVSVIVQANTPASDIANAVGEAVQRSIPAIVEKVRLAMGEKVPPAVRNTI
jgi:TP901 family phage tail tape measure protein